MVLVTAPARRAGRGRREAQNPLVVRAQAAGIPILRPERASDPGFLVDLARFRPDLGVVVSYGQLLRRELLDLPRFGCINLHASLLPRWRGASPIQAAILAGDERTGVCLQRVVLELDAGPVLAARETAIGPRETAAELAPRLAELGAELLRDFLDGIGAGPLPPGRPQDEEAVTVCRRLKRSSARIDWTRSATEIDRLVRAMAGWPVAFTTLPDGEELRIHAGEPEARGSREADPGTILGVEAGITVACGEGVFRIQRLQRPGRAVLAAAEFLRGRTLRPGEILG